MLELEFVSQTKAKMLSSPCWDNRFLVSGELWTFLVWVHPSMGLATPHLRYLSPCCESWLMEDSVNEMFCRGCKGTVESFDQRLLKQLSKVPMKVHYFDDSANLDLTGESADAMVTYLGRHESDPYQTLLEGGLICHELIDKLKQFMFNPNQEWWSTV